MKQWKCTFIVAGLLGVLVLVAACSSDNNSKTSQPAPAASSSQPTGGQASPAQASGAGLRVGAPTPQEVVGGERWIPKCPEPDPALTGKTVGAVSLVGTDQGLVAHIKGFQECGEKLGWKIQVVDAAGDYTKAAAAMDDFVSRKVDLIYNTTMPPDVLGPQLQRAAQAKIPYIGSDAPWGPNVTVAMPNDLADAPSKLAWYIGDRFQGKAAVGVVNSKMLSTASLWEENFMAALKAYPEVKVVDRLEIDLTNVIGSVQQGVQAMLQRRPEINVIWISWEDPVIGACNAKKALNSSVEIISILTAGAAHELWGSCLTAAGTMPEGSHGVAAAEQAYMILKYGKPSAPVIYQSNGILTKKPAKIDDWFKAGPQAGMEYIIWPGPK
ncbi:MAG: hypothetical protein EPO21_14130 [Chloroflexota bacterium]|nr:MAG: hypothetical protein EPO21_14130 [Chloroflexota bacterium]